MDGWMNGILTQRGTCKGIESSAIQVVRRGQASHQGKVWLTLEAAAVTPGRWGPDRAPILLLARLTFRRNSSGPTAGFCSVLAASTSATSSRREASGKASFRAVYILQSILLVRRAVIWLTPLMALPVKGSLWAHSQASSLAIRSIPHHKSTSAMLVLKCSTGMLGEKKCYAYVGSDLSAPNYATAVSLLACSSTHTIHLIHTLVSYYSTALRWLLAFAIQAKM
eukprot:scaffold124411_cov35-Prasinocladus_malaysianus.AAC.1